jgi:hypothetical protein
MAFLPLAPPPLRVLRWQALVDNSLQESGGDAQRCGDKAYGMVPAHPRLRSHASDLSDLAAFPAAVARRRYAPSPAGRGQDRVCQLRL